MWILKKYNSETKEKGILIFTHNETNIILTVANKLKPQYFFIQHIQFNVLFKYNKMIDLNFKATYKKATYKPKKDIKIASCLLIDECFFHKFNIEEKKIEMTKFFQKYDINFNVDISNNERTFDFIYNGRSKKFKKTKEVMTYFGKIAEKNYKCCMIMLNCNYNYNYTLDIWKIYNSFSEKIKNNILLIDTKKFNIKDNRNFSGFRKEDISLLLQNSKIYIHGCENEGGSRSIHEAICCGCCILVKENLTGGGLNNLPKNGHILYKHSNYETKMLECLKKYESYECCEDIVKNISGKYTIPKLLNIIYERLNYKSGIDNFIDSCNLGVVQLQISGHDKTVPWYDGKNTSQITNAKQLRLFLKYLNPKNTK